jgi:hypothetical protein
MKTDRIRIVPGSARVWRAGCGVPPQQSFRTRSETEEVRDREDAIASTRDPRATRKTRSAAQGASL